MIETLGVDRWIYTRLSGDATIAAAVGTRIYSDRAPQKPTAPYIVYKHVGGWDVKNLQGQRIMVYQQYLVKAVQQTADYADVESLATRIDALLQDGYGSATGVVIYNSQRTAPYRLAEDDYGVEYRQLGGFFDIIVKAS